MAAVLYSRPRDERHQRTEGADQIGQLWAIRHHWGLPGTASAPDAIEDGIFGRQA